MPLVRSYDNSRFINQSADPAERTEPGKDLDTTESKWGSEALHDENRKLSLTGGRRRYFVHETKFLRQATDVEDGTSWAEGLLNMGYVEVNQKEYIAFGREHAGPSRLNNVYLSDKTHTKLRNRVNELVAKHPDLTIQNLASAIIENWVKTHLEEVGF